MGISEADIKRLWGRAANYCALCQIELSEKKSTDNVVVLGVQAHIVGENSNSARWKSILTTEERNSYFNLILLCPNCHTKIDKNEADYPVERLYILKAKHEEWVANTLKKDRQKRRKLRPAKDLFTLIARLRPILIWFHRPVPAKDAPKFIQSLQVFWVEFHNIALAHLKRPLVDGIEHLLRPITDEASFKKSDVSYMQGKLYWANHQLRRYFQKRSFSLFTWADVDTEEDAPPYMIGVLLANTEELVQKKLLTEEELPAVKFALYVLQYYEECFKLRKHLDIPESFVMQFFAVLEHYLDTLGFELPALPNNTEDVRFLQLFGEFDTP